jgi:two-component system nitrate/nitrite response regulator NarL
LNQIALRSVSCVESAVSKSTVVIIVAQRVLLREGIASLLQSTRFKVVAAVPGPDQLARVSSPRTREALALVAVDQQNGSLEQASECIRRVRSLLPESKVVLLVETNAEIDVHCLLALSPDGCLVNVSSQDVLHKALELTVLGQRVLVLGNSAAITTKHDDEKFLPSSNRSPGRSPLSQRESQILELLAQGKSNKAMARLCNVSEPTIKAHLKTILRKTHTQNRTQAAIWAIEHGCRKLSLADQTALLGEGPTLSPVALAQVEYDNEARVTSTASGEDDLSSEEISARRPQFGRSRRR